MEITINKFGYVLTSRQSGKEAYAAFLPTLRKVNPNEKIIVDLVGVNTLSPSWGDEFLSLLLKKFGNRVEIKNAKNLSVAMTLSTLEELHGYTFKIL